jgi:hypothetical protein
MPRLDERCARCGGGWAAAGAAACLLAAAWCGPGLGADRRFRTLSDKDSPWVCSEVWHKVVALCGEVVIGCNPRCGWRLAARGAGAGGADLGDLLLLQVRPTGYYSLYCGGPW